MHLGFFVQQKMVHGDDQEERKLKQFTCHCLDSQFKSPDQVFVGFDQKSISSILCAYRPKQKVTLRNIKMEVNYCPYCGAELKEL